MILRTLRSSKQTTKPLCFFSRTSPVEETATANGTHPAVWSPNASHPPRLLQDLLEDEEEEEELRIPKKREETGRNSKR